MRTTEANRIVFVVACELVARAEAVIAEEDELKKNQRRFVGRRRVHAPQREQSSANGDSAAAAGCDPSFGPTYSEEILVESHHSHCSIFIKTRNCSIMNNGYKVGKLFRF